MLPSLSCMRKKPLPLIAMSSELLVGVRLPWLKDWATAATRLPMPICRPDEPPTIAEAYMSAKIVLPALKPTVLALATLLETTSSAFEEEFRPLRPCWNAMIAAPDQRICLMSSNLNRPRSPTCRSDPVGPRTTLVTGPNCRVRPWTLSPPRVADTDKV